MSQKYITTRDYKGIPKGTIGQWYKDSDMMHFQLGDKNWGISSRHPDGPYSGRGWINHPSVRIKLIEEEVMTDQKHTKETLVEEIAYKQLGREQSDDFLAKLFLLEQFLEIHNSNLRRERDELRDALVLILPLAKGYMPNGQTQYARRTCDAFIQNAEDILTKTKGAV